MQDVKSLTPKAYNAIYLIFGALIGGCSLATIIIVDQKFWDYATGYYGRSYVVFKNDCTLGSYTQSSNLCYFNWCIAAFGGFMALTVVFMAMCNCRPGRATPFLICLIITMVIWAIGAGVNTAYIPEANDEPPSTEPERSVWRSLNGWRNAVLGISWAAFALCLGGIIAAVGDLKQNKRVPPQAQFAYAGMPPAGVPYGQPAYGAAPSPPGMYNAPPPGGYPPAPMDYPSAPMPAGYMPQAQASPYAPQGAAATPAGELPPTGYPPSMQKPTVL